MSQNFRALNAWFRKVQPENIGSSMVDGPVISIEALCEHCGDERPHTYMVRHNSPQEPQPGEACSYQIAPYRLCCPICNRRGTLTHQQIKRAAHEAKQV